jgi:hypothetical protein
VDNFEEKLESKDYQYLLIKFKKEKISSRFDHINNLLKEYIVQNGYENRLIVSQNIVEHIVIDYFVDIDRLKEFQEIEHTNEIKVYAYLAYWMLRHKPLQIVDDDNQDELVFVNEEFVTDFLCSFLFSNPSNVPYIAEQKEIIDDFVKTLSYHLAYRSYSAQNIELMLLAFQAGRGYQYSVDYQK